MDLTGADWRKSSYSSNNGGACIEVTTAWRKSTYTSSNGGNCVEVAPGWRKSSHGSNNGGACIEVAAHDGPARVVAVRDSKDPDGPKLAFAPAHWRSFMHKIKAGALALT
jgi:hypothetical protein